MITGDVCSSPKEETAILELNEVNVLKWLGQLGNKKHKQLNIHTVFIYKLQYCT